MSIDDQYKRTTKQRKGINKLRAIRVPVTDNKAGSIMQTRTQTRWGSKALVPNTNNNTS